MYLPSFSEPGKASGSRVYNYDIIMCLKMHGFWKQTGNTLGVREKLSSVGKLKKSLSAYIKREKSGKGRSLLLETENLLTGQIYGR